MPSINIPDLILLKRYSYFGDDGDNNGGIRYAFFAFFALLIVIFLLSTCMINVRRMRRGSTPIISHYLAPPSYYQSNTTNPQSLPTYTENPNPNQDAGYYDQSGNFIPYHKPEQQIPQQQQSGVYQPATTAANPFQTTGSTAAPASAYYNETTATRHDNIDTTYYAPPPGPPPINANVGNDATGSTSMTGAYVAPAGPPPSHLKN